MKCLLGVFSPVWTPMSTKIWGFACYLFRNMFALLVMYFVNLTPLVHFSFLARALHITTSCTHLCTPCHALINVLFTHLIDHFASLECHIYFMLCSILLLMYFVFCLCLISHLFCTPYASYPCSYFHFFPSFFLVPLSICAKKGREYTRESIGLLCTFVRGEIP